MKNNFYRQNRAKKHYNKYGNIHTRVDDRVFDSKREAQRYQELKLLEKAGVISNLRMQPKYELVPKFQNREGAWERAMHYVADFEYVENGVTVVEDVKGMETQVFKVKIKMFKYLYPQYEVRITR